MSASRMLFKLKLVGSDGQMKLHEALVVFFDSSRQRYWFKEKGSGNGNSVCFQPFVEQRVPSRGLNKQQMVHEALFAH